MNLSNEHFQWVMGPYHKRKHKGFQESVIFIERHMQWKESQTVMIQCAFLTHTCKIRPFHKHYIFDKSIWCDQSNVYSIMQPEYVILSEYLRGGQCQSRHSFGPEANRRAWSVMLRFWTRSHLLHIVSHITVLEQRSFSAHRQSCHVTSRHVMSRLVVMKLTCS